MAGTEEAAMEEPCLLAGSPSLTQLTFFNTIQDYQIRDSITYSGLPLPSIIS